MVERIVEEVVARYALPRPVADALCTALSRALSGVTADDADTIPLPGAEPVDHVGPAEEERYETLGPLGAGGMGEVHRVHDHRLNRVLAMKVMRTEHASQPLLAARFLQEAQATAQLQHPGIVAVHDLGRLPDGRPYFTMAEIRGRTLSEEMGAAPGDVARSVVLRRLVGSLHRAAQAVAFAHERGVIHRDLKPDNIMVGRHGEVLVVDWGLARVTRAASAGDDEEVVVTDLSRGDSGATRVGTVAGTPAYMAPEQARGEVHLIDARTDVYALGAILYEILGGCRPYAGLRGRAILAALRAGAPEPLVAGPQVPRELVDVCDQAMARGRDARFAGAGAFADALERWLDGELRTSRALEVVRQAEVRVPVARELEARVTALRAEAATLEARTPPWAPEADKLRQWTLEDEVASLADQAALVRMERDQLLLAALTHAPELPEAHAVLVAEYRERHVRAERSRDRAGATRAEGWMRRHALALPGDHPVRAEALAYLTGNGALTLVTDPPGAQVELRRFERRHRRLVEMPLRHLGATPLLEVPLERGSYLCVVRHPERAPVRYPVYIGRGRHWDGVPPDATAPLPIHLPRPDALGPEDHYVPAGWFTAGDGVSDGTVPADSSLWCDGFVMSRFPITNAGWLAFLDELVDQGREEEALRHAPREKAGQAGQQGALILGRDAQGHFELTVDTDGDRWERAAPVVMVDWDGATAFAAWAAGRSGLPWRLPWDLEWEKAARGADGRLYPWGDGLDPTFCCFRASHRGRPGPQVVDSYPLDVSPYGVRGLAGNVRDWCVDAWTGHGVVDSPRVRPATATSGTDTGHVVRGGGWWGTAAVTRSAYRNGADRSVRDAVIGVRLARSL